MTIRPIVTAFKNSGLLGKTLQYLLLKTTKNYLFWHEYIIKLFFYRIFLIGCLYLWLCEVEQWYTGITGMFLNKMLVPVYGETWCVFCSQIISLQGWNMLLNVWRSNRSFGRSCLIRGVYVSLCMYSRGFGTCCHTDKSMCEQSSDTASFSARVSPLLCV